MNTWALLLNDRIVNTVTTEHNVEQVRDTFPGYEVRDIYTLPRNVQEAYQYWNERP